MKELCRVKTESRNKDSFKVVVEIKSGDNREVLVSPYGYDSSKEQVLFILSGGVTFDPRTLKITCSKVSVPEVLLHIELCKFVYDTNPFLSIKLEDK